MAIIPEIEAHFLESVVGYLLESEEVNVPAKNLGALNIG